KRWNSNLVRRLSARNTPKKLLPSEWWVASFLLPRVGAGSRKFDIIDEISRLHSLRWNLARAVAGRAGGSLQPSETGDLIPGFHPHATEGVRVPLRQTAVCIADFHLPIRGSSILLGVLSVTPNSNWLLTAGGSARSSIAGDGVC